MHEMNKQRAFIDTRHPYRVGWPRLAALPLETCTLNLTDDPDLAGKAVKIMSIIGSLAMSVQWPKLVYRYHEDTPDKKELTLLLVSNFAGSIGIWVEAVTKIVNLLDKKNRICVELIHFRLSQYPLLRFPIKSDEFEILQTWNKHCWDIVKAMEGRQWLTLDLVYRERLETNDESLTVTIGAKDADEEVWEKETMPSIRAKAKLPANYGIEVFYLPTVQFRRGIGSKEFFEDDSIMRQAYQLEVPMGSPCALRGCMPDGTIGGVIRLSDGEEQYAITNHHVACRVLEKGRSNGPAMPDPVAPGGGRHLIVDSPSDKVHAELNDEWDEMILKAENDIESEGIAGSPELLKRHRDNRSQYIKDKADAKHFNRRVGHVYASSGSKCFIEKKYQDTAADKELEKRFQGSHLSWVVDWALIEVDKDRGRNVSHRIEKPPQKRLTHSLNFKHGDTASTWTTIEADKMYLVAKRGRTTGWTVGRISAAKSIQRSETVSNTDSSIIPISYAGDTLYIAHSVFSSAGREQAMFCTFGDSGSLVLANPAPVSEERDSKRIKMGNPHSDNGKKDVSIVGMVFGGSKWCNIGYMTPFDCIVEDIERKTKRTVIQPSRSEREIHTFPFPETPE